MRPLFKFGLLTAGSVCLWNLVAFSALKWVNQILVLDIPVPRLRALSGIFGIIILIGGIWLGISAAKNKNKDQISYGTAIRTGISISIICALIAALFALFYCTIINPRFQEDMVKDAERTLIAAHESRQEINRQLEQVRAQFNTSTQVMQGFIAQSVLGTLATLIIGLFVKTKKIIVI